MKSLYINQDQKNSNAEKIIKMQKNGILFLVTL